MKTDFELIDSGEGARLERFGERVLIRPSSLAIWRRRFPEKWSTADAEYVHDHGWRFTRGQFDTWNITAGGVRLKLRTQRNGQIGFFPEHTLYLNELASAVKHQTGDEPPALLNLFAYTGMASIVAAKSGAAVTHVDILKTALDWARENLELNELQKSGVRLIPEEALVFLEREQKRARRYQVIVLDPPGFSRISKNKSWNLDEILPRIAELLAGLIEKNGEIFFTAHGLEHGGVLIRNLLLDALPAGEISERQLEIAERGGQRSLPAGQFVHWKGRV